MRIRNLWAPLISKDIRLNFQLLQCWTGITCMLNGRPCMSNGIGVQSLSDTTPVALTVSEPSGLTTAMSALSVPPSWSIVVDSSQTIGVVAVTFTSYKLRKSPIATTIKDATCNSQVTREAYYICDKPCKAKKSRTTILQTLSAYYYMHAQYYANEVWKSCASLAELLASFIVDVIWA